jgi:hypothetical protein
LNVIILFQIISSVSFTRIQKLYAEDGTHNNRFGISVSKEFDFAFIGASKAYNDNYISSGSVYSFIIFGSLWSRQSKILAKDGIANDNFGASIYINNTMTFIGSPSILESPSRGMSYILITLYYELTKFIMHRVCLLLYFLIWYLESSI